jgi:hypoxia-inducible factor (prolyl hydroxylase)
MEGCAPLCREEVQLTCYPGGGAQYVRHVDNNDTDAAGKRRRGGRHVTAIFYPNLDWREGDGGALRLHVDGGGDAAAGSADASPVDVSPVGNRLVCFWSDARVPHEVESAYADRYAVSAWYHDTKVLKVW